MRKDWLIAALFLYACLPLAGQTVSSTGVAANGDWARVMALPVKAKIHVSADKHGAACSVVRVDADSLSCSKGGSAEVVFARSEVKKIRMSSRGRSAAIGGAIGAGVGAGVGAGIGAAINNGDQGNILHVSGGKAAGVGAGVGAIVLGITGAAVGAGTDAFGSVIYKR